MNEIQRAGILWYNTGITDVIGAGITDVIGVGITICIGVAIGFVFLAFVGIRVPT